MSDLSKILKGALADLQERVVKEVTKAIPAVIKETVSRQFQPPKEKDMPTDQTPDKAQQLFRKFADFVSGALVLYGIVDESTAIAIGGFVVQAASLVWWWYWNTWRTQA